MKITHYDIVQSRNPSGLVDNMITAIAEGWQPIGGIGYHRDWYQQAVVKYERPYPYGAYNPDPAFSKEYDPRKPAGPNTVEG